MIDLQFKIKRIFAKHDVLLNDRQCEQFEKYIDLILSENAKYNLTSITDIDEMIIKHMIDSVLPYKYFKANASVVDIGAGAGFPSIPLMIVRNDLKFLIIDSVNKKVEFIKMVARELNLNSCEIIHTRCEDVAQKIEYREKFEYCVARGVANLSSLLEYCVAFVKINGEILAYKGKRYKAELEESKNTLNILHLKLKENLSFTLKNDDENIERNIMVFSKTEATPKKYPRLQNKVRLRPLG